MTVSICECPCTRPFPALLIIKSKQWTLLACVKYAQDFPTNTRTIKTTAEVYELERQNISVHFFPILLSSFLLVYFLHLLNISGELVICQTLCYT